MKTSILALLFTTCFFILNFALAKEGSDVHVLNKDNYDKTLKETEFVFIKYYAPWCGHCRRLAPEWEKIATFFKKKKNIKIAKVNADNESDIAMKAQVRGYPTLKLYKKGQEMEDYSGPRSAGKIIKWLKKQMGYPVSTEIKNKQQLKQQREENSKLLVGVFNNKEDDVYKKFIEEIGQDDTFEGITLVEVFDKAFAKELTSTSPSFLLYLEGQEKPLSLKGEDIKNVKSWLLIHAFPAFEEYSTSHLKRLESTGLKLVLVFLDKSGKDLEKNIEIIREIAKSQRGKIAWTWFDGVKQAGIMKKVGLKDNTDLPAFSVMDIQKNLFYPYKGPNKVDKEALAKWSLDVAEGRLEPDYKSQEPPKEQKEAVWVVVRKTFEKIVYDKSTDVLVEFYAPWCHACKDFESMYLDLAEKLKSVKNLRIVKVDTTQNDTPIRVKSFPTIMYFPSDKKDKPISFKTDRNIPDMVAFLKKHAVASKGHYPKEEEKAKPKTDDKKDDKKEDEIKPKFDGKDEL